MKTKLFLTTFAFFALLFALLLVGNLFAQFGGGRGTEQFPYLIYTKEHLKELVDSIGTKDDITYVNWSYRKHFKLMNDITDSVNTMIGIFQGHFDGNRKKIIVSITQPTSTGVGIFTVCTDNGIIENLIVYGRVVGEYMVGGIVGVNYGLIRGCINYASVKSTSGWLGGIVCNNAISGKIDNCINYATMDDENKNCIGGIVGHNSGYVSNCMNAGTIKSGHWIGGIVGHNDCEYAPTTIERCINIGTIITDNIAVGGIVGGYGDESIGKSGYIYNGVNSGLIIGKDIVGGIIGARCIGEVKNCLNTGAVKGNTKVGCIVGENQGGTIINCHYDKQMCGGGE